MSSEAGDGVILRSARPSDAGAIDVIEAASFAHAGERFTPRRVRYVLASPRFQTFVAQSPAGDVMGWAGGLVWTRGVAPWGRVYVLAVDPTARGRSLGRRLMEHLLPALALRGAARIYLEVRPDNAAAIRLYERLGFVACRTLPNFYAPGFPAIRMVRG